VTRIRQAASSYRARLLGGYVLIAVIMAAAWLWWLYGPLTSTIVRQQEQNLTAVAQAAALAAGESNESATTIARQLVARTNLRLTIVRADGTVAADTKVDPATMENHSSRPEIAAALAGRIGRAERVSRTLGTPEIYVAVPAVVASESVALRVAQPLDEVAALAAASRGIGIILLLVAFTVALFIAARESSAISRPIGALSHSAKAMAEGNLGVAIPEVASDLAPLAEALADLRGQIRGRIDELETEQRTLRTALDGLPDAVFLVEAGAIRFANGAAAAMFGMLGDGFRGRALEASGLPAPLVATAQARMASDVPVSLDLATDPVGRSLRLTIVPLEHSEAGLRALLVVSDITERTRLDRVRRDFVANASHELKTPVTGIQLLAESAESAAEDGEVDQAIAFARQISAESQRLKRLVGDLLDLSRLESTPAPDSIADVRKAAHNAVIGHRAASQRKELSLSVDETRVRAEDVYARIDPTDLAIALDNLVDNAIAYTEQGSVVVGLSATEDSVTITVTDTGLGIPPQDQQRIFERFYRVDRARSRDSGGTGLGLALVKHVVERAGGSVTASSDEQRPGSIFTIALPRAR
jgi:two-component system phosphate regulon sensor histidine kinase PhoR